MADRKPTKKRRQAQNKALREERAARAAAAKVDAQERRAAREPDPVVSKSPIVEGAIDAEPEPEVTSVAPRSRSSVFSSRRKAQTNEGSRPARTASGVARSTGIADAPAPRRKIAASSSAAASSSSKSSSRSSSPKASTGGNSRAGARRPSRPLPPWLNRFGGDEPGGKWVLLSFVFVLVATAVVCFTKVIPERVMKDGKSVTTGNMLSVWHFGWKQGLAYVLPPVVVVILTILLARKPDRRRTWNYGLVALVMLVVLSGAVYIYMFAVASLGWGCWQARKAALEDVGGDPKLLRERNRELRLQARANAGRRKS